MTEDDWDLIKFFLLCMAIFVFIIVPIGLFEDQVRDLRNDCYELMFRINLIIGAYR